MLLSAHVAQLFQGVSKIVKDKRTGLLLPVNARRYAKGYSEAGASTTKRALKGMTAQSGSPNEDINYNNYTLRQRSRILCMSSPLAAAAVKTNRTKIIGTGLALKASVDADVLGLTPEKAKEWQRRTEAEFAIWAEKPQACDALALNNFCELQQLAVEGWLMSGDVFPLIKRYDTTPLMPYSLRLHLIEADRISTPNAFGLGGVYGSTDGKNEETGNKIFDGVEVDKDGKVVAYHIRNNYPQELSRETTEWKRVLAYGEKTGLPNILHVMEAERPDQYRGVPYLAPVIEPLLQLRRFTESELVAALIQSYFTAWVKTTSNTSEYPWNEVGAGGIAGESIGGPKANISDDDNEYEMGPGTINILEPDEDVVFGSPNIPTAGFDTFNKSIIKQVGAALELPYDVYMKEFNSSYSASRGAIVEAWEGFKMKRVWFVNGFCQPIYEMWLSEAVARGRIHAPGFFTDPLIRAAWCGTRWIGPTQGSLDPLREVKAAILMVQNAYKTHSEATRELSGGDFDANVAQLRLENELLAKAGAGATTSVDLGDDSEEGEGDNVD